MKQTKKQKQTLHFTSLDSNLIRVELYISYLVTECTNQSNEEIAFKQMQCFYQ